MPIPLKYRNEQWARGEGEKDKYLESLFDLFHEHITVSSEAIDRKYRPVGPGWERVNTMRDKWELDDIQSEDFGGVASLDAITFALAGVASNDSKVSACDGKNCAAIFCIRIEGPLLRVCNSGHVGHGGRDEMGDGNTREIDI